MSSNIHDAKKFSELNKVNPKKTSGRKYDVHMVIGWEHLGSDDGGDLEWRWIE